jgi:hypothetical protein
MTARKDTCAACRFFEGQGFTPYTMGRCRRHAPTVTERDELVRYGNPDQFKRVSNSVWPPVTHQDWCGDFLLQATVGRGSPHTRQEGE